ncbi:MAG: hypothetical protein EOM67_02200 [Spirochaetia bacterium]|nr:hypothetical protein [Spirochaetia bacterium]
MNYKLKENMATLYSVLQDGLLVDRAYLQKRGINRTAVDYYIRSGKLIVVAHGVYRKPGPSLTWQHVVYSLNQMGYKLHVGQRFSLGYYGFEHYVKLGKQEITIYCSSRLPQWINIIDINFHFIVLTHNPFKDTDIGIVDIPFGHFDWTIKYSSPERAFLELMSSMHTSEDILHAKIMMEGAMNLRPDLLQNVLADCKSIKAKRLFMWLSKSVGHPWYRRIDASRIDFGSGKRQIVTDGVFDPEFNITVPKEPFNGDSTSIF